MDIPGLDVAAWDRWVSYRKAIKKPLKEASLHAAAIKLSKFGDDQAEVVDQSIGNQWTGLFPLPVKKLAPGEKPKRTKEQTEAADAYFQAQQEHAARGWDDQLGDPIGRLKLCEALWCRYTVQPSDDLADKLDWLKGVVAMHLREADAVKVMGDPHLMTMVWCLFGAGGARRIKERAAVKA